MSKIYGLIGSKLGHSFSRTIHKKIFEILNKDAYYHLFEVEAQRLEGALQGLKILGAGGVNVTIPYKGEVMKYLDAISHEAKEIGAVNTIKFENNQMLGYNTDYYGFKMMLEKNKIEVRDNKIVILGSGGAADSVLQYFLSEASKEIIIVSRNYEKSKLKYKMKNVAVINYEELKTIKNGDIIVNCTPCGMYPNLNEATVDSKIMGNYATAIDLIYNPSETLFLRNAAELGLVTLNGLYMLVAQAVAAQEIWNDTVISEDVIDSIYSNILLTENR